MERGIQTPMAQGRSTKIISMIKWTVPSRLVGWKRRRGGRGAYHQNSTSYSSNRNLKREREFFIDNLLVRIHLIIKMIQVDRPRAMGV